jgi:hypothetical protein
MTRPTKDEVDEALRLVSKKPQAFVDAYGKDPVATLAAEVLVLRQSETLLFKKCGAWLDECEELKKQLRLARASVDRLETIVRSTDFKDIYAEALEIGKTFGAPALVDAQATIARVEALPAKWRAEDYDEVECAQDLEAVLKGGAS